MAGGITNQYSSEKKTDYVFIFIVIFAIVLMFGIPLMCILLS